MSTLAGASIIGRLFAVWPATLQVMPEGILDSAFGLYFVGARIQNGSTEAWPAAEIHISTRGRCILSAAGIAISNSWLAGDAAALGQCTSGEWIPIPALQPNGSHVVYFKLDVTAAVPGTHALDLTLRDPTSPNNKVRVLAPLTVVRSSCSGPRRTFSSVCDKGILTAAVAGVSMDIELFRRALARARVIGSAASTVRTPAERERQRHEFREALCNEAPDICDVLADVGTSCALPVGSGLPATGTGAPPATPSGLAACALFADESLSLADRVGVTDGIVASNHALTLGCDDVINASMLAGGDVTIGDRTTVFGNVTAAGAIRSNSGGGAKVTGAAVQGGVYSPQTIATKTVTPGTTNVSATASSPQSPGPGSFGTIQAATGSTLTLRSGTYHCAQFVLNTDVTLVLDQAAGPIDVRVRDNLAFGDRDVVTMSAGSPAGSVAQFYTNQTSEVRVGTDIDALPLAMTAPSGTIHVYSRSNVLGSLVAKNVTVEPDCLIGRVPVDAGTGSSVTDTVGTGASGLEFLGYPTSISYSVAYRDGFYGATGPLAFELVTWKAMLANAVLLYDLGIPGAVGAELVGMADQAVIGSVKTSVLNASTTQPASAPSATQAGSVDAAIATIRGNRALGFPLSAYQDAAVGEPNAAPISSANGNFTSSSVYLTNSQINSIISNAASDPTGLRVHKSSAATGVTHGLISALVPVLVRDDESGTLYFVNQLLIVEDPSLPSASGRFAAPGDSGGLWIQTRSNKVVGLGHMVGTGGVAASRIEDVANALNLQFA